MIKVNNDRTVTLSTGVVLKLPEWRDIFKFIFVQEGYYQMVMNKHIDMNAIRQIYDFLGYPKKAEFISVGSDGLLVSKECPDDYLLICINAGVKEYKKDIESPHFEYKAKNGTKTIISIKNLRTYNDALIHNYLEYNDTEY